MKKKQYVETNGLAVSKDLHSFVNDDLLPKTNISSKNFWSGFSKSVHELAPKNKKLLTIRDEMQKNIDQWHFDNKGKEFDLENYKNFLIKIGYLVKEGKDFSINTKNVDTEISNIAGPQLVVPVMNARYSLNAANARWGSLYNALYGTDVISESDGAQRGKKYNYIRGEKVIEYARNFLDVNVPLTNNTWKDISEIPKVKNNQLNLKLKNPNQFVGYNKKSNNLSSLLFKNNNLHIDVLFDLNQTRGGLKDKAAIYDIILESAITSIMDHEDSVAAVDAKDKVHGYRNWLGLMKGDLKYEGKKNTGNKPFTFTRKLNSDRKYISPKGKKIKLHGRALMLNRNVGHLMTNPSIKLRDGSEIPEGIMDAFMTTAAAIHDFKNKKNSRKKSFYIVKPKMHGPDEVAFTNLIFEKVEKVLNLKKYTIKIGIMDEERRTTVNLKECIRAVKNRVVFINTGFLDRTGDEMHTSMEAGPMIKKGDMKSSKWIAAYENNNVDVGLACGFSGIAQIGKGMWAAPDKMADMMSQKINHPKSGANCAWVPSPTAATLHALHYHQVDVFSKQKELKNRTHAKISDILVIPTADRPNWSVEEITKELENNAQGILGYVVRWVDQGVGCSKVPDINNVGLMEDRATLRISSQHIANWLHHGVCSKEQVLNTMKKMAKIVDKQNIRDPDLKGYDSYKRMSDNFDESISFKAACDLVFKGLKQPSGYTEPILHQKRLEKKSLANNRTSVFKSRK
jgi:malate synthase